MAMLNEILVGRFNQLLTRLLTVVGGSPSPQVTPEIQPVLVVQGDSADLAFLKDERLMVYEAVTGAAVGKFSYLQVANPAGSNLIITIEGVLFNNATGAGTEYQFGLTTVSTRAAERVLARDSRINDGLGNAQTGPGRCTSGSDLTADGVAGTAFQQGRIDFATSVGLYLPVNYVLHPGLAGNAFTIWQSTANTSTNSTIFYRARKAAEGELLT